MKICSFPSCHLPNRHRSSPIKKSVNLLNNYNTYRLLKSKSSNYLLRNVTRLWKERMLFIQSNVWATLNRKILPEHSKSSSSNLKRLYLKRKKLESSRNFRLKIIGVWAIHRKIMLRITAEILRNNKKHRNRYFSKNRCLSPTRNLGKINSIRINYQIQTNKGQAQAITSTTLKTTLTSP